MAQKRLGVGFIGSGFVTRFHIRGWTGVRDADVRGVWSLNRGRAEEAAALARMAAPRVTGRAPSEALTPLYLRRPDAAEPARPKAVTP